MRGLLLLLPVLLVLFLAGTARTEEESSLVEDADLPSNLLPAGEEVAVRKAREAKKDKKDEQTQKDGVQKRKERRRLRKVSRKRGLKNNRNDKKNADKKNQKKNRSKKREKKKKRKTRRKNGQRNSNTRQKKKEGKKKKKKQLKLQKKRKNNKNNGPSTARQASGGDWSSCGTTGVNDTCLINAVNALNFEKNQIQNFFKQKARLQNQNKVTGNKKGKKGEFEDAAGYMLQAIGGDINSPSCGENSTRLLERAADSAVETYNILINCSATIHEACDMPNGTINSTFMDNCADIYNKSKTASDDCRSNEKYTSDGAAACNCWEKAAIGIEIAKKEGCTQKGKATAVAVKKQKNKCMDAFKKCKGAEDAAVALIHTCMSGEVNTNASSAEKDLTSRLWV